MKFAFGLGIAKTIFPRFMSLIRNPSKIVETLIKKFDYGLVMFFLTINAVFKVNLRLIIEILFFNQNFFSGSFLLLQPNQQKLSWTKLLHLSAFIRSRIYLLSQIYRVYDGDYKCDWISVQIVREKASREQSKATLDNEIYWQNTDSIFDVRDNACVRRSIKGFLSQFNKQVHS
jgi:hypothetical protein